MTEHGIYDDSCLASKLFHWINVNSMFDLFFNANLNTQYKLNKKMHVFVNFACFYYTKGLFARVFSYMWLSMHWSVFWFIARQVRSLKYYICGVCSEANCWHSHAEWCRTMWGHTRIKGIEISCVKNGWTRLHAGEVKVHRNKWMILQNGSVGLGHIRHSFYGEISWSNTTEKQNDERKNK